MSLSGFLADKTPNSRSMRSLLRISWKAFLRISPLRQRLPEHYYTLRRNLARVGDDSEWGLLRAVLHFVARDARDALEYELSFVGKPSLPRCISTIASAGFLFAAEWPARWRCLSDFMWRLSRGGVG